VAHAECQVEENLDVLKTFADPEPAADLSQAGEGIDLPIGRAAKNKETREVLLNKAKVNYWVDVGIGLAGLLSAISGLVFLLPGDPTTGVLGISYRLWTGLHTWSSLAAIAGVGAHMALHWKWMVAMTGQIFAGKQRQSSEGIPAAAYGGTASGSLSRRAFLALGGAVTLVAAAVAAGYKAIVDTDTAEASLSSNQQTAAAQASGVACPFGLVNDPYPGRCRHYRDSNGDGYCDYSVAGSGSNLSTGDNESFGGFSRQRSGAGRP
jgi:hypothetical protein